MTDDPGIRELLSFLLARDTMHQNQWAAAVKELQEDGLEEMPVPSNFPQKKEATEHSYTHYEFSDGQATAQGSWAAGPPRTARASSPTANLPGPDMTGQPQRRDAGPHPGGPALPHDR
ncbi:manganese catalase family protein [Staphylococcus aureus]|uniref:manganese catalase family protein n=1 Tax=Staphylococcus aureus TaxID=1280 RepID=UPI003523F227